LEVAPPKARRLPNRLLLIVPQNFKTNNFNKLDKTTRLGEKLELMR
jgi:hypothetical protein